MPPLAVVNVGSNNDQGGKGFGRYFRSVFVTFVLFAGIACVAVVASTAGPVELEEPSSKLTPFPFKEQLSTDDLIAIMNGKGYQDVNAAQGMLFAGGAGGKILRSQWGQQDVSYNNEIRAAQRASKIHLDSATSGFPLGSDGDDEYADITAERHKEAVAARHAVRPSQCLLFMPRCHRRRSRKRSRDLMVAICAKKSQLTMRWHAWPRFVLSTTL